MPDYNADTILRLLRMRNTFGNPPVTPSMPAEDPNMAMRPDEFVGPLQSDAQQLGPASSAFNTLAGQYPSYEDYKPSGLRRVGSALIGIGQGPQAQEAFLRGPHNRAVADWKNKIGASQAAANLERYADANNITERRIASQTGVAERKADIAERAQTEKERANLVNEETRRKRADVYAFKAQHPNWIMKTREDGRIIAINPMNPEQTTDTGIDGTQLSDMDKISLNLDASLQKIGATGEQTRQTEGVRQTGRESLEGIRQEGKTELEGVKQTGREKLVTKRGEEARTTKKTPGAPSIVKGEKAELPTQTRVRVINKATQVRNEHPEWNKWINIKGNDVSVKNTSTFGGMHLGGPDAETRKKIVEAIYGPGGEVSTTKPAATTTTTTAPKKHKLDEEGRVWIQGPNGQKGTVIPSDADKLPKGWSVVGE